MKHRWDGQITKRVRYVTCVRCGCVKQTTLLGYVYSAYDAGPKDFVFKAPHCTKDQAPEEMPDVKYLTRDDVVPYYVQLIKKTCIKEDDAAVLEMNNKILDKWRAAGLEYIKNKSWAIVGW